MCGGGGLKSSLKGGKKKLQQLAAAAANGSTKSTALPRLAGIKEMFHKYKCGSGGGGNTGPGSSAQLW